MDDPKLFPTKSQPINTLQEGQGFGDGKHYSVAQYKKMADAFYAEWSNKHHAGKKVMSNEEILEDYWKVVETNCEEVLVEYGNDLDTTLYCSGFPRKASKNSETATKQTSKNSKSELHLARLSHLTDQERTADMTKGVVTSTAVFTDDFYCQTAWNLNNIAYADGSVLKHLRTAVNGVNVPWLYMGMLFASFCWHNEDNYFNSVNYSHFGADKQWYGVPCDQEKRFERVSELRLQTICLFSSFLTYTSYDHRPDRCRNRSYWSSSRIRRTYCIT